MDTNIYNEKVMGLKAEINQLEDDILKGRKKVETLADFDVLFQYATDIIDNFNGIYMELPTNPSKNRFLKVFEKEQKFLEYLSNLVNVLRNYHNRFHFMSTEEIQLEWKNVKTFLQYIHLESEMDTLLSTSLYYRTVESDVPTTATPTLENEIEENSNRIREVKEEINALEQDTINAQSYLENLSTATERVYNDAARMEFIKRTEQEALESLQSFIDKLDDIEEAEENPKEFVKITNEIEVNENTEESVKVENEIETKEDIKANTNEIMVRKEDIVINQVYLATLPTYEEKLSYLKLILANIEALPGRKKTVKYNENKKRINKYYMSYWIKAYSKIKEIEREEDQRLVEEEQKYLRELARKEEYANLTISFRNVEEELFRIANLASPYLGTNKVVATATFKGEPFYVLKTDLNEFNRVFMDYKILQHKIKDFANKWAIDISFDVDRFEEVERKNYEKLQFLQMQEKMAENLEKLNTLKEQFKRTCQSKAFAIHASVKTMFHKLSISEEKSAILTEIIESPLVFLHSKDHSDEEKRNTFSTILSNVEDYLHNQKEHSMEKFSEKSVSTIEKVKAKIQRCIGLLPKKKKVIGKILNIRDGKDKKKVVTGVLGVAAAAAMVCGTFALFEKTTILEEKNKTIETVLPSNLNDYQSVIASITDEKDDIDYMGNARMDSVDSLKKEKEEQKNVASTSIITPKETHLEEINDKIEENHFEEENTVEKEEYRDMGDFIKVGNEAKLYSDYIDAINEVNGNSFYFDKDTLREITGITYEYNDEIVFVSNSLEDAEDIMKALEANGAHQINYRVENEKGIGPGSEGFVLAQDSYSIENGNGMGR